jgi:hypothetical protein
MMLIQRSRHKFGRKLMCRPRYLQAANTYYTAAGVTDAVGKKELSTFINLLRDLDLWDSCILGMALAGRHNAGSGTRAHAFKGGYGTLVNGPTWGADGLLLNGINTTVNLSDKAALNNTVRTGFVVLKAINLPWLCNYILSIDDGTATSVHFDMRLYSGQAGNAGPALYMTRGGAGSANLSAGRSTNQYQWQSICTTMDDTSDQVYQNAVLVPGGSRTGLGALNPVLPPPIAAIGGGNGTGSCTQAIALMLLFAKPMSGTMTGVLHDTVKRVLLPELGLP